MLGILRSVLLRFQPFRDLQEGRAHRRIREEGLSFPIVQDYPFRSQPRYGYGAPPHEALFAILDRNRQEYAATLRQFMVFSEDLRRVPMDASKDDPSAPCWRNNYFSGLDAISLYSFAVLKSPHRYVEIGSGNSTKFMRRAIRDHYLRTRVISIDPYPRVEADALCDEIHRTRLEETDLSVFDGLVAGDIVFLDGSHRVFMNSDVTVAFLDILPRLKTGVLVYIDDIYLPLDYPPEWISRYYSEQYLLAVLLLAEDSRYEVILPCTFVGLVPELQQIVEPLWKDSPMAGTGLASGTGFWLRRC
jgi:predicted O-methyltransferase YrrM